MTIAVGNLYVKVPSIIISMPEGQFWLHGRSQVQGICQGKGVPDRIVLEPRAFPAKLASGHPGHHKLPGRRQPVGLRYNRILHIVKEWIGDNCIRLLHFQIINIPAVVCYRRIAGQPEPDYQIPYAGILGKIDLHLPPVRLVAGHKRQFCPVNPLIPGHLHITVIRICLQGILLPETEDRFNRSEKVQSR